MKPLRTFGLAALISLIVMGATASSAMGNTTKLCSADENPCSTSHTVTHVHDVSLSGHKMVLKTNITTVECDILFLGDTLGGNAPLEVEGRFTFSNCGSCTVAEEGGPGGIAILRTGHETAEAELGVEVRVNCSGISCTYLWPEALGVAKGPLLSSETNGDVTLVEQSPFATSGLFCPGTNKLSMTLVPLSATYIAS